MHPNSALPNWDALLCTRAYCDSAQRARPIPMNFRAADASRTNCMAARWGTGIGIHAILWKIFAFLLMKLDGIGAFILFQFGHSGA